jgi:hypothetical protein
VSEAFEELAKVIIHKKKLLDAGSIKERARSIYQLDNREKPREKGGGCKC